MAALNEGENTVEVLNYKDSFHPCHVLETLKKLYLKKELCDVVLIVDEQEIKAHRVVLAANSVYFYSMFTTDMCESVQERIPLKAIDYEAVELLVDFCYTSSIKITEKNVQSLLSVSNLLQFNTVIESCCGFVKNQLHPANCLGIGDFADHHGFTELKAAALCFAEKHFLEVIKCDEFLSAPFEQVSSILKSDFLDVASEKEVFDAIVQWISHDEFPRKKHLAEFLKDVRLPLLPPKILGKFSYCKTSTYTPRRYTFRYLKNNLKYIYLGLLFLSTCSSKFVSFSCLRVDRFMDRFFSLFTKAI